jgi:hypothetical protein
MVRGFRVSNLIIFDFYPELAPALSVVRPTLASFPVPHRKVIFARTPSPGARCEWGRHPPIASSQSAVRDSHRGCLVA